MTIIVHVAVEGLFGDLAYSFSLNKDPRLTIVTAPNGFGKSTLLRIIAFALSGKYPKLLRIPFKRFQLRTDAGLELEVRREIVQPHAGFERRVRGSISLLQLKHDRAPVEVASHSIEEVVADRGRKHSDDQSGAARSPLPLQWQSEEGAEPAELVLFRESIAVAEIPASRLIDQHAQESDVSGARNDQLTVQWISSLVTARVDSSMREYAERSQELDRTFPGHVITDLLKGDTKTSEMALQAQLDALKQTYIRYAELGLIELDSVPQPIPPAADETVQKILRRYYDQISNKLDSFSDVADRLELLLSAINERLYFKKIIFNRSEGIEVKGRHGDSIPLTSLSSGEQHLLVIFGTLLFADPVPDLILLDEPEISLHLDWQDNFLPTLEKILHVVPASVLVATHSPTIINGRWELCVELAEQTRGIQ